MEEKTRKLATIRMIDDINPIPDADAIEAATVGGWKVVVKKGDFQIGDFAVFLEIDSWVPHELAPFLTKDAEVPKEYDGVPGARLKTLRLRKQLSQGLLLPLHVCWSGKHIIDRYCFPDCIFCQIVAEGNYLKKNCPWDYQGDWENEDGSLNEVDVKIDGKWTKGTIEGLDVTDYLGVIKWEPKPNTQLAGQILGRFPHYIQKTDQERVQNMSRMFEMFINCEEPFEVTEKLDGSSMTVYLNKDGEFGVCSRNLDLLETEDNAMWKLARELNLEVKLRTMSGQDGLFHSLASALNMPEAKVIASGENFCPMALQGEIVGPGIQKNPYKLKSLEFRVFDIWDIKSQEYVDPRTRRTSCEMFDIPHVPVIYEEAIIPDIPMDEFLVTAGGPSRLNENVSREGLVYKHLDFQATTFKIVSNEYLLKHGDR